MRVRFPLPAISSKYLYILNILYSIEILVLGHNLIYNSQNILPTIQLVFLTKSQNMKKSE